MSTDEGYRSLLTGICPDTGNRLSDDPGLLITGLRGAFGPGLPLPKARGVCWPTHRMPSARKLVTHMAISRPGATSVVPQILVAVNELGLR